jgi:hypothetical protein
MKVHYLDQKGFMTCDDTETYDEWSIALQLSVFPVLEISFLDVLTVRIASHHSSFILLK